MYKTTEGESNETINLKTRTYFDLDHRRSACTGRSLLRSDEYHDGANEQRSVI
jgi:hypothetical protein